MTKNDFDQIILKARKLFEEGKESYNLPDLKEDAAMWNVVMGDAYPTSDVDPNVVYDMFLGAFVLSKTMDKIPWNDNVHVYEGWKDKKDKAWFVNDSMEGILKDGPKHFRFSANSCIDGVFGPLRGGFCALQAHGKPGGCKDFGLVQEQDRGHNSRTGQNPASATCPCYLPQGGERKIFEKVIFGVESMGQWW